MSAVRLLAGHLIFSFVLEEGRMVSHASAQRHSY
jgi:hypothetical protein